MQNKNFKYFLFKDVFDYERGRRLVTANQVSGDVAYISSTALNNGVDNYIEPPSYMKVYNNKLTLSNSGSVGCLFYHDYDFVASDHVMVVWPKEIVLNKYIAMFLKPVFEAMRYKYNFGREINEGRLSSENLLLPVNSKGEVDWEYMEFYMKQLEPMVFFECIKTENSSKDSGLNVSDWNYFQISSLFDAEKGNDLVGGQELGDIPLISATAMNNGVSAYISGGKKLFDGNMLTVSTNGSIAETFYQAEPFFATSDVCVLTPKNRFNKYIGVFMATVIANEKYKYSYGRKFNLSRIKSTQIKLPINKDGNPDWDYMENYIKSLPYSDLI